MCKINKKLLALHIVISLIIGGVVSYYSEAKWLAAAFWVSAAMYINGSIAYAEDARPGGFDNPDGKTPSNLTKGWGASKFALSSLGITIALVVIGYFFQVSL